MSDPVSETNGQQRVVMRYPVDETKEPGYLIIQACVVERCLKQIEEYANKHGLKNGLGPIVSDLRLMAMAIKCAIDNDDKNGEVK